MDGWDDSLIYGEDPGRPAQAAVHEVEADKPPETEPQFDGPITTITISGLAWWVQDKDIEQQLKTVGEGIFQLLDMELLQEESGKFRGIVQCQIRTDEPELRLSAMLQHDLNLETATPETKTTVRVSSNRSAKTKAAAPSKLFKPAPMLYDDPENPIPRYLLPERPIDRPKKPDDSKRGRKEREREGRHRTDRDRERDRDRRHRRDERDRDRDRDYYSDYDDDYEYDRRAKDDREDRKRRRDDDRYREDRKRRK
jgi:hypothetical protein